MRGGRVVKAKVEQVMIWIVKHSPSNNRTQGMVRWLSEDSLRIYARDSRHTYAHWLDKAMQANVDAKQVANLPTLDDDNAWSQLQDWIKLPDDDPNVIGWRSVGSDNT